MRSLVFKLLLLASLTPYACLQKILCFLPGECKNGVITGYEDAQSYNDCRQFCQEDDLCKWFTHFPNNICIKFENCPSLSDECPDCVSAERNCPRGEKSLNRSETRFIGENLLLFCSSWYTCTCIFTCTRINTVHGMILATFIHRSQERRQTLNKTDSSLLKRAQ